MSAFVIDAYFRRILGWRVATTMRTSLVLEALERPPLDPAAGRVADLSGRTGLPQRCRIAQHTSLASPGSDRRIASAPVSAGSACAGTAAAAEASSPP